MILPPLRPHESAVLCIDVQRRFCTPSTHSEQLPQMIGSFAKQISPLGVLFVYTRAVRDLEVLPANVKRFRELKGFGLEPTAAQPSSELCEMFMPANHIVINKTWFDVFVGTTLGHELKIRGIRNVVMCGMMTDICVDASARRAVTEGYDTYILSDLVATAPAFAERGNQALAFFADYYGYVLNSAELVWNP